MKNKKLKATLSITGYFLLLLAICFAGALVFHSYYYEAVYISGASMSPTLMGDDYEQDGSTVDFGIVDAHKSAINHIKRFDIVSTYYPDDYLTTGALKGSAKKKIKRVIALPNETFTIKDGLLSVKDGEEFVSVPYTFKIAITNYKDTDEPVTLGENEYWVLGDNRSTATSSRDCATIGKPIKKDYIAGVLVAIEGRAKLKTKDYRCDDCGKVFSTKYSSCPKCGSYSHSSEFKLVNKKYHWPKFF